MLNDLCFQTRSFSARWVSALLVIAFILTVGCDGVVGTSDADDPSFATTISHSTLSTDAPETKEIAQGQYGDLEDGAQLVLRNEEEFEALWEQLHAHRDSIPALPTVNFEQETVVAVVMGSKPTGGYSVSIDEALLSEEGDAVQVQYTEVAPADNCNVTMAFTSPYVLATVDASVAEASFSGSLKTRSCSSSE